MKGCLAVIGGIVVLVVLAMIGLGGYFGVKVYKAMEQFSAEMTRVEVTTNSAFPFTPPNLSRLDPSRYGTAIAIREKISSGLSEAAAQAESAQKESDGKGFMEMMGEFKDNFSQVPGRLEAELMTAKMSADEYFWLMSTGHGTVFAAADQGDPRAKELEAQMKELMRGPGMSFGPGSEKQAEGFDNFRARMKASLVQFDPGSIEVVVACGAHYPGSRAAIMVDGIMAEYSRNKRLGQPK